MIRFMTTISDTRVCIIEDNLEFLGWLKEEIEYFEGYSCVGDFSKSTSAIAGIPDLKPGVVLVDLSLEDDIKGGIFCMLSLKKVLPDTRFMVITSHADEGYIFEALKVGADAYLLKSDVPNRLQQSLADVIEGRAPMSPSIASKVMRSFQQPAPHITEYLTTREQEVLQLISQGFLNKEIHAKLGISENTVKVISHNIYKKLHVNNRVEAVRKYLNV